MSEATYWFGVTLFTVEPDSHAAVTVKLPAGSVETADGRGLESAVSATIAGPVGISIGDARVEEGVDALLAFVVTLSRAASGVLTVDYATADGSAQAGADYTGASGTLTFQAGESSKTIDVTVLDDAHDEGEETLTLTLSNASAGRLADGEATGTIKNRDPLPRALLARFGRTAAVHIVEQVEERVAVPREPGFRGELAGRELRPGMEREMAPSFLSQLGGPRRRESGRRRRPRSNGRRAWRRDAFRNAGARRRRRAHGRGRGGWAEPRRWPAWPGRWAWRPGRLAARPTRPAGCSAADCCRWASAAATR